MAMWHYLKNSITEERVSNLSKRKRKRHRVGEFKEIGFMFIIPNENLDWNNKTLDIITDYCENNNLALFGWAGHNGIHGTVSSERNHTPVVQSQLDNFKNFIQSKNIEIYCTKLIDFWYDEEFMDKWYDSSLESKKNYYKIKGI